MAQSILGIDIGYDRMKLALVSGSEVKKTLSVSMPDNLFKNGRVVSVETMGELIRKAMKEANIRCNKAAVCFSGDSIFVRNVSMPQMNHEQLMYNLPFDFKDYLTGEMKEYAFDYAMISTPEELEQTVTPEANKDDDDFGVVKPQTEEAKEPEKVPMRLLGVAVPLTMIDETRQFVRKAGLKLVKAAPVESALANVLKPLAEATETTDDEYCILDLGYNAIRLYVYINDSHTTSRVLEIGLSSLDNVISEEYNVDVHLAHTYLLTNHDNCQENPRVLNSFASISVELMRALNFFKFSNPNSTLNDIYLTGGGCAIPKLKDALKENIEMNFHDAAELVKIFSEEPIEEDFNYVQAIGITQ